MKKASIKNNFIYNTLYQIFLVVVPFITTPYVSRILRPEGIGIQSYTNSVLSYFTMIAALGTSTYGAREISRHRDHKEEYTRLFWEIEEMSIFTSAVCVVVWVIMALLSSNYKIYYLVLTINILATMLDISWLFSGLEEFRLVIFRNLIFKLLGVFSVFLFVRSEDDLMIYILIQGLIIFCSNFSLWFSLPGLLGECEWRKLRPLSHLRETFIYFLPNVASSVYLVSDKIFLQALTGEVVENGYYAQAEKLVSVCKSFVFMSLNTVVGVRISYLFAEERFEEIGKRIDNSLNYILFTGIGCMFGIWSVANEFVPLFFGQGYEKVISLLYIFAPIILVAGLNSCLNTHYYTPSGKRAQCIKYISAGAILNCLLNIVLIPRFRANGAVFASLMSETLIIFLFVKYSCNFINLSKIVRFGWKKILAGTIMFLTLNFFLENMKNYSAVFLIVKIFIGIIIYIFVLILLQDQWVIGMIKYVKYNILRGAKS